MHTDLSSHLHTPECRVFIDQLKECHQNNKFGKFLGICNDIDSLVVKCCKNERKSRQAANYKKSVENRDAIKDRLKQTTASSGQQSQ